ncbi:MAG: RNA polymerase sigma factor [Cyclobacteriaceae bacterium]
MNTPTLNIHKEIIDKCRLGDSRAQHQLYLLYSKAMFNTSVRICGSREDAEDALQESFVSAFRNIKSYRGDASFGAWLKRIVINKSLNQIKKRGQEIALIESAEPKEDYTEAEAETFSPNYSVIEIRNSLNELAPGFRTVLSLYLFEGYDHQEISEILGISESTSKTQYKRAKERLKSKLIEVKKYG